MIGARSRVVIGLVLAVIVVGVVLYVGRSTDTSPKIGIGSEAADAFGPGGAIDAGVRRGVFSPDGSRVAAITANGVGVLHRGHVQLVTPAESAAVDAAWMPDSRSLLIAEGPAMMQQLTVLTLDGAVKGVARLDQPFSVGFGFGLAVDNRGGRAVAARETRGEFGGRHDLDLMLVDLTTGHVTNLTRTPDVDESTPVFVDDNHLLYASLDGPRLSVLEVDLRSGLVRTISGPSDPAIPVGVLRNAAPVLAGSRKATDPVLVWALLPGGERFTMGRLPKGTTVQSVSPRGTVAVVTAVPKGVPGDPIEMSRARAVTLTAPTA